METLKSWFPAIAGMVCMGMGAGLIGIYGFFVEPLSKEFGVGVAVLNIGPVALLLVPGIVAPFIGKLADRVPIQLLMLTGVSFAMLSLFGISKAPLLWVAGTGFVCMVFGLTMYGPVVVNGLMIKIYRDKEARALAIVAMGISVATATLPPLTGYLLENMDWRSALQILAIALFAVLTMVILVAIPRGVVKPVPAVVGQVSEGIYRQPAFWLVGFCVALGFCSAIVLAVCYPSHFASMNYSVAEAGWFLSLTGIAGLAGKTCIAWLGDAASAYAKWIAIALLLLQALGLTLLLSADSTTGVMVALSVGGFGGGAFIPMHPFLNSQYFDAAIIGQVNGAQMPLFLPFGVIGAPLAGYVFDQTGSFHNAFVGLIVAFIIAALFAAKLPAPAK
jgi:predicted MFS family arabinose efflux permease